MYVWQHGVSEVERRFGRSKASFLLPDRGSPSRPTRPRPAYPTQPLRPEPPNPSCDAPSHRTRQMQSTGSPSRLNVRHDIRRQRGGPSLLPCQQQAFGEPGRCWRLDAYGDRGWMWRSVRWSRLDSTLDANIAGKGRPQKWRRGARRRRRSPRSIDRSARHDVARHSVGGRALEARRSERSVRCDGGPWGRLIVSNGA